MNAATIIEHSSSVPFQCVHNTFHCFYCYKKFEDFELLRVHTRTDHIPECRKILQRLGRNAVKLDISSLDCRLCDQTLLELPALKDHLRQVHMKKFYDRYDDGILPFKLSKNNDLFSCHLCSKSFNSFHNFNQHMNTHFNNYICETCGSGFVSPDRLLAHRQVHDAGTFPCDACGKEFSTLRKQKNHVERVHERRGKLKCPQCPQRFMEHDGKLKHLVKVHGAKPLTFPCDLCNRVFASRRMLTTHTKRDHLKELRHGCNFCDKKFFSKSVLIQHLITHTGERNFECQVCKKTFAQKKTLKQHMRTHNNDRRFVCNACGQAFIQNSSLNNHMKVHHPFSWQPQ